MYKAYALIREKDMELKIPWLREYQTYSGKRNIWNTKMNGLMKLAFITEAESIEEITDCFPVEESYMSEEQAKDGRFSDFKVEGECMRSMDFDSGDHHYDTHYYSEEFPNHDQKYKDRMCMLYRTYEDKLIMIFDSWFIDQINHGSIHTWDQNEKTKWYDLEKEE